MARTKEEIIDAHRRQVEADRLQAEARKIAAAQPEAAPPEEPSGLVDWLVIAAIAVGMLLGTLYGFIRFVKWAWSD